MIKNYPGGATPAITESFIADDGTLHTDGLYMPIGRPMLNGSRATWLVWASCFVSGRGANREVSLSIGPYSSDPWVTGAASRAVDSGHRSMGYLYQPDAAARVLIRASGSVWFGRASGSGGVTYRDGGSSWPGGLSGQIGYYQAPTPPTAIAIGSVNPTTLRLAWSGMDDGDGNIYGYRVQYATNAQFSGAVTRDVTGSPWNFTGLQPGTRYWFRIASLNEVTRAAGTTSVWSNSVNAMTQTVPGVRVYDGDSFELADVFVHNGSGWDPATSVKIYNGTSWVDPT